MKRLFIFSIILLACLESYCQSDTSKIEQYCEVVARPRLLSNKVTIELDLGEEKSIWKDNRLKNDDGRLKKFNTVIDALNFMGKEKWTFVNAFPVYENNTTVFHYVFKKFFPRSEVMEQ